MPRFKSIEGMRVNAKRCKTCPFNDDGDLRIRASVEERCVTQASQLCHGTNDTTLCKGARDFQLQIFYRLGWIPEATQAAWDALAIKATQAKRMPIPTKHWRLLEDNELPEVGDKAWNDELRKWETVTIPSMWLAGGTRIEGTYFQRHL